MNQWLAEKPQLAPSAVKRDQEFAYPAKNFRLEAAQVQTHWFWSPGSRALMRFCAGERPGIAQSQLQRVLSIR